MSSATVAAVATRERVVLRMRTGETTAAAGTGTTAVACDTAPVSAAAAPPAPDSAQWLTWHLQELAETAAWHARCLRNLARRHGSRTDKQRRRLFDSVVRHVNAGDVDLDEANAFLHSLGIGQAAGPGEVSFRVPVAMAMIHEDAENDVGTFQYHLEEHERCMRYTRLDGYPNGFRVARPSRADIDTGRRHTIVSTDLRLTVTVPAYTDDQPLIAMATAMLCDDLTCLPDDVDIVDEPSVWDLPPTTPGGHADTERAQDVAGGWAYQADELDEGNYINYGLDVDHDETADEFDHTRSPRPRDPFAAHGEDSEDDETDDWQYDR